MSSRKRITKMPRGWTKCPKLREAYEEGGKNIGKMMVLEPDRAKKVWSLIAGTGIYPKWYLEGFRYHWIKDNPMAYHMWKKGRYEKRLRKRRDDSHLADLRQKGLDELS